MIYCCKECVAPVRHPGCHAECSAYQQQKAQYEERKAKYDKDRNISGAIYGERSKKVINALKGYRGNKHKER